MSKKNKKAAWKRRNEQAIELEKKRLADLKKRKRDKKVTVKGKNLKRMGVIPKTQKLQKTKRTADDMMVDTSDRPMKRRRMVPEPKEENEMVDVSKTESERVGERPVSETPITQWVEKELKYDWSRKKKFQGHRNKEFKAQIGMKGSAAASEFKKPDGKYVFT